MTQLRKVYILDSDGNPLKAVGISNPALQVAVQDTYGNALEAVSAAIPQLKTTLYDINGSPISSTSKLPIDSTDHAHQKIHEGNFYNCGHYNNALAAGANLDILITTGVNYGAHVSPLVVNIGGDAELRLYEGVTVSVSGTALVAWNARRSSTNTTESSHYHTPTVIGVGTQLGPTRFISGACGQAQVDTEAILNAGTNYLLRVTNITGVVYACGVEYGYYEDLI